MDLETTIMFEICKTQKKDKYFSYFDTWVLACKVCMHA